MREDGDGEPRGDGALESRPHTLVHTRGLWARDEGRGLLQKGGPLVCADHGGREGGGPRQLLRKCSGSKRTPRPLFRETRPPQGRHIDPLTWDRHSPKDPQSEAARTDANNLKTPMAKKPQLKSTSEEDNRAANCGLQRTRL